MRLIHLLTEAGTMFNRILLLGPAALLAAACSIDRPYPTDASVAANTSVAFSAVKFWDAGATVGWNQLATDLTTAAPAPGINAIRLYTYLSLAQLRAAEAAQAAPGPHPPIAAAIGGASVVVLSSSFPGSGAQLEAALDAQDASDPWPGAKHADFAAGEASGRAAGARVLSFAQGDLVGLTSPLLPPIGPPPVGPGYWIYAPPPVIALGNLGARPFFLTSQDQLRSAPPPAFGSDAFNAALAEVRQISDTRTQEQINIANYWNVNQSTHSPASVREWTPWLKKQVCHDSTREFTIDSTWRRGSRWAVVWPRSRWRRTSTRSPRAPGLGRLATAITHTIATADLSGGRSSSTATAAVGLFFVSPAAYGGVPGVSLDIITHSLGLRGRGPGVRG